MHLLKSLLTRRELLTRSGMGFASLGLMNLLASSGNLSAQRPLTRRFVRGSRTFPARPSGVIHLFMNGGPSHVDTFDPKPACAMPASRCRGLICAPSGPLVPRFRRRSNSSGTAKAASR